MRKSSKKSRQGADKKTNILWRSMTEPVRSLSDPEARRRARLLAAILVVLLPAAIGAIIFGRLVLDGETEQILLTAGSLLVVTMLFVALRLARTVHVQFAAWLALIAITAVPVGSVVLRALVVQTGEEAAQLTTALSWTLMPVLLSNFVMPLRHTAFFVLLLSVGIGLLPAFLEPLELMAVLEPLGFVVAVSALVMVGGDIRREDQLRIDAQNAELSISEQRFRGLFDGTSVSICIYNTDHTIADINHTFMRLFGFDAEDATQLKVTDLVVEDDRKQLARAVDAGHEEALELVGKRRDGSTFELEARPNSHVSRGERVRMLEFRDISELKIAQADARDSKKTVEAAAVAQGQFLVHAGRSLRNPLGQASKVVHAMATNKAGNLRAQDMTFLRRLYELHGAMDNKIKDILLLSMLESGKGGLSPTTTMLDRLTQTVVDDAQPLTRQTAVSVSLIKPDLVAPITLDSSRLLQVLRYLMAAAIAATDRGFVTLTLEADANHRPTTIMVSDASAGMTAEALDSVKMSLQAALTSDSPLLGLVICRLLTELVGCRFEVTSAVTRGTTYTIHLAEEGPGVVGGGATDLFSDDEYVDVLCMGTLVVATYLARSAESSGLSFGHCMHDTRDLTSRATRAKLIATSFETGPEESNAFGRLGVALDLPQRPPVVAVALTGERVAVLGVVELVQWPPSKSDLPRKLRRLQAADASAKARSSALIVVSTEAQAELAMAALSTERQIESRVAIGAAHAMELLRATQFDAFVVDSNMALSDQALELLATLRRERRYVSVPLLLGVTAGDRLGAARRLQLVAEAVARSPEKAGKDLSALMQTLLPDTDQRLNALS